MYTSIRVIPSQINKEFWVTSQILMKLIVFVVPMVLTSDAPIQDLEVRYRYFVYNIELNLADTDII